jgi:hypothetical protein
MTTQAPAKKAPAKKLPVVKIPSVAAKRIVVKKVTAPVQVTPAKTLKPSKPTKPVKHKLVRDSFTIPKDEYQVLGELKARLTKLMQPAKKSELLRAGLKALASMSDAAIKKALQDVPAIKTGRPAKK